MSSHGFRCLPCAAPAVGRRYVPHADTMPNRVYTVGVENDDIVFAGEYIRSSRSYLALGAYT